MNGSGGRKFSASKLEQQIIQVPKQAVNINIESWLVANMAVSGGQDSWVCFVGSWQPAGVFYV